MKYVINPDDFKGSIETVINDNGTIGYSKCLTLEEYKKENSIDYNLIALEWDEFVEKYLKPFNDSLCGEWKEITEEDWDYALNVLPPYKWHDFGNIYNVFFCQEAQTAHLRDCYIRNYKTNKYYHAIRSQHITDEKLIEELKAI